MKNKDLQNLIKGSVKDLLILKKPTILRMGIGRWFITNDYSVFDWGKVDSISYKSASLCIQGALFIEKAEEKGIYTHYRGLVTNDGKLVRLDELEEPTNIMEINLVRVIHPIFIENGKYDYSAYTPKLSNFLIPLEVIYRNSLPGSSSVFRRLKKGDISYKDLGLDHYPKPGEKLKEPIFDVSTKLEEKDRYITWKQAQSIACLTNEEVNEIKEILSSVNNLITKIAGKVNLVNEDGKIELAYDPKRKLMLVDVFGTLDECKFTYNGLDVSKEVARKFHRRTQWYKDLKEAKKIAEEKGIKEWKKLCKSQPEKMDQDLNRIISNLYTSTTNALTNEVLGKKFFDSPKLEDVVKECKDWEEEHY